MKSKPCVCNSLPLAKQAIRFISSGAWHELFTATVELGCAPSLLPHAHHTRFRPGQSSSSVASSSGPATASLLSLSPCLPPFWLLLEESVDFVVGRERLPAGRDDRRGKLAGRRHRVDGRTGVYIAPSCRSACGAATATAAAAMMSAPASMMGPCSWTCCAVPQ